MDRPNILFLMSDQHTAHLMGCAGAHYVRTPNIDSLAARGVRFANAYCAHPHCVPSRATMMTGLHSHKIPCFDNGSSFRSDLPTWAHLLRHAGYHTSLNGKMHFVGADYYHGFHQHLNDPPCQVGGFRWGEEKPDPTTGKRYWGDLHFEGDPVFTKRMAEELAKVRDATHFLANPPTDRPWCHVVSFSGPHYPQVTTRALYDSYAHADIPQPSGPQHLHPRHQHWRRCWGFDRFDPQMTRNARRAYLAMITQIDLWLGEVLQALDTSGHADNTLIIYTADHGEMWGEHGLWGKQVFFEESAPVPLIICGPGIRRGATVHTPVSLLDIFPTFRELVDPAQPWHHIPLDGRSLIPALTSDTQLQDRPVFSEYYGPDTKGPERMLRYQQWKLDYYHHQGIELFDLDSDPHEHHNLADNPDHRHTRDQLYAMLTDGWNPQDIDHHARIDQNRRSLIGDCYPNESKGL